MSSCRSATPGQTRAALRGTGRGCSHFRLSRQNKSRQTWRKRITRRSQRPQQQLRGIPHRINRPPPTGPPSRCSATTEPSAQRGGPSNRPYPLKGDILHVSSRLRPQSIRRSSCACTRAVKSLISSHWRRITCLIATRQSIRRSSCAWVSNLWLAAHLRTPRARTLPTARGCTRLVGAILPGSCHKVAGINLKKFGFAGSLPHARGRGSGWHHVTARSSRDSLGRICRNP